MLSKGFNEILNDLSDDEFKFLMKSDPYFITDFCYMLSLELQLNKESKK